MTHCSTRARCFFTNASGEAKWRPCIKIDNKPIAYEEFPRLLGVILDSSLSFGKQVEEVVTQATKKVKMMGALSHTEWGWRKYDQKKTTRL